jgi:hypothetical protein
VSLPSGLAEVEKGVPCRPGGLGRAIVETINAGRYGGHGVEDVAHLAFKSIDASANLFDLVSGFGAVTEGGTITEIYLLQLRCHFIVVDQRWFVVDQIWRRGSNFRCLHVV